METGWKEVKRIYQSFFTSHGEKVAAQQTFHRLVHWLYKLMPEEEARDFMMAVVDPDPIIDWETGLMCGDPCPQHPDQELGWFVPPTNGQIHLKCMECPA